MRMFTESLSKKRGSPTDGPVRLFDPAEGARSSVDSALAYIEDFGRTLLPGLVYESVYEDYAAWCSDDEVPVPCDVFEKCLKENGLDVATMIAGGRRVRVISPVCIGRPRPVPSTGSSVSVTLFVEREPPEEGEPLKDVYERYQSFCSSTMMKAVGSPRVFFRMMHEAAGTGSRVSRVGGKTMRVVTYRGSRAGDGNGSPDDDTASDVQESL